jgi:capsule polysaccharide export protein KpsE/RkpR
LQELQIMTFTFPKKSAALLGALLLAGCSSTPPAPTSELQAAERAIAIAERAQVIRYTSTDLNNARTELTAARNAIIAENMPQAQRLALQSQLSAELALAQAELVKAQAVNKDMQQSIDALQHEAQRNTSGVRP